MWRFTYEYSIRFPCTLRKTHIIIVTVLLLNLWPDTVRKSWTYPSWRSWSTVVSSAQVSVLCGTVSVAKLSTTEAFVGMELPIGAKISGERTKIVLWRIEVAALVLRIFLLKTSSRSRFRFAFKLHFVHRSSLGWTEFFLITRVFGQFTGYIFVNRRPPWWTLFGKSNQLITF